MGRLSTFQEAIAFCAMIALIAALVFFLDARSHEQQDNVAATNKVTRAVISKPLTPEQQKKLDDEHEASQLLARESLAQRLENAMLAKGQSVTITIDQKDNRQLNFKFVLVSKAFTYQMEHQMPDMNRELTAAGFRSVLLTDGHSEFYAYSPISGY